MSLTLLSMAAAQPVMAWLPKDSSPHFPAVLSPFTPSPREQLDPCPGRFSRAGKPCSVEVLATPRSLDSMRSAWEKKRASYLSGRKLARDSEPLRRSLFLSTSPKGWQEQREA